jgi:hypothetical protein
MHNHVVPTTVHLAMPTLLTSQLSPDACAERLRAEMLPDDNRQIRAGKGLAYGTVSGHRFAVRRVQVWRGYRRRVPWIYGLGLRGELSAAGIGSEIHLAGWGDRFYRTWSVIGFVLGALLGLFSLSMALEHALSDESPPTPIFVMSILVFAGIYFLTLYPRAVLRGRRHQRREVDELREWVATVCEAQPVAYRG